MRLRISRHADRQVEKIRTYIARDNPYAADRVVEAMRFAARRLIEHPEMGRAVEGTRSREWIVRLFRTSSSTGSSGKGTNW